MAFLIIIIILIQGNTGYLLILSNNLLTSQAQANALNTHY